jgi:hypothetical protein
MAISGTPVQYVSSVKEYSESSPETLTATLPGTATSGNILLFVEGIRWGQKITTYTVPTGYTIIQSNFLPRMHLIVAYKISDGTETSVTSTLAADQQYTNRNVTLYEFSNSSLDTTVHASAINTVSRDTAVTSVSTGTASLTGFETGLAIGIGAIWVYNNWIPRSWSNSFTEQSYTNSSKTDSVGIALATRILSASGSYTSTLSTTGTATNAVGAIVIFRASDTSYSVLPDETSYDLGDTVQITATPAFPSAITTMTLTGGDVISAESGATTSSANFVIPDFDQFVSGGSAENTRLNVSLTATVSDGTNSAETTIKINPPTGSKYRFFTTDKDYSSFLVDAKAWLDGTVIENTVTGDDVILWNTSGSIPYITDELIISFDALPSDINVRFYDVSAGGWSAAETQSVTFGTFDGAVKDDFFDDDDTLITAHTPLFDEVGGGWSIEKEYPTAPDPANEVKIKSGRLWIGDGSEGAVIDVGEANHSFSVDWIATAGKQGIIQFRRKDAYENIGIWFRQDTSKIRMRSRINGQGVNIGAEDYTYNFVAGQTYTFRVEAQGNSIKVYINDASIFDIVLETHQTSAHKNIGLFSSTTTYCPTEFDNIEVFAVSASGDSEIKFDKTTYNANTDVTMSIIPTASEAPNSIKINGITHSFKGTPTTSSAVITLPDVSDFLTGSFNAVSWKTPVTITLGFPTISDIVGRITIDGPEEGNVFGGSKWYGVVSDGPSGILRQLDSGAVWYANVTSGTIRTVFANGTTIGTNYDVDVWSYNGTNWEQTGQYSYNWDKSSTRILIDPNGRIDSANPRGEVLEAALTWSQIPNYSRNTSSGQTSINMRQFLSGTDSETETISILGTLPDGWTFSGDSLSYDGIGSGSSSVRLQAGSAISNYFTVSAVATTTISVDTLAPPVVTNIKATPKENGIDVEWDRVWDTFESAALRTGVEEYLIYDGDVLLSRIEETQPFPFTRLLPSDIGTVPVAGSYVQSGNVWTLTGSGYLGSAPDKYSYLGTQYTGPVKMTCRIDSIDNIQGDFTKVGIIARQSSDAGSPYYAVLLRKNKNDIALEYRTEQNETKIVATNALVPSTTFPVWLQLEKTATTWIARCSTDGGVTWNNIISKPSSVSSWIWGVAIIPESDTESTATLSNISMAYSSRVTYSDTTTTTRNYKIKAVDGSNNYSEFSPTVTASPTTVDDTNTPVVDPDIPETSNLEWYPGNYVWIKNQSKYTYAGITKENYPNIRGYGIEINWKAFETEKDQYSLPAWIVSALESAIENEKKIIFAINDVESGVTGNLFPTYMVDEGHVYYHETSKTNYTLRWKAESMDRVIKAYKNLHELVKGYSSYHGIIITDSTVPRAVMTATNGSFAELTEQYVRQRNELRVAIPTKMISHWLTNTWNLSYARDIMQRTASAKIVHGGPDPDPYTLFYADNGSGTPQTPYPRTFEASANIEIGFSYGTKAYIGYDDDRKADPNRTDYRSSIPSAYRAVNGYMGEKYSFLPSELYSHLVTNTSGPQCSYIYWDIPYKNKFDRTDMTEDEYYNDYVLKNSLFSYINNLDNQPTKTTRPTGY